MSQSIKDNENNTANLNSSLLTCFLEWLEKTLNSKFFGSKITSSFKYLEIKEAIEKHFSPKTIEIAEQYKFHLLQQDNVCFGMCQSVEKSR